MSDLAAIGKMLISGGLLLLVIGGLMWGFGKFLNIGKLPGDIFIQRGNFTIFFPIVTMIVISIFLTIVLNLFLRR